jgi:hypothetical protein
MPIKKRPGTRSATKKTPIKRSKKAVRRKK